MSGQVSFRLPPKPLNFERDIPDTPPCPRCAGAEWLSVGVPGQDYRTVPCECITGRLAEQRLGALLGGSGLEHHRGTQLCDLRPLAGQAAAFEAARRFLSPDGPRWLVMHGPTGTGKTTLAVAIGNELMESGRRVVFRLTADVLAELRSTFDKDSGASYEDRSSAFISADVLILDDWTGRGSQWGQDELFRIIARRAFDRLSTVVTTNLAPGDLEPRVRSRVHDGTLCTVVHVGGPDRRVTGAGA